MENINDYILSICFVIIFCIVIETFTPSESYRGIIKIVLGVFVLYTLMFPLKEVLDFNKYNLVFPDVSITYGSEYEVYMDKTLDIFKESMRETSIKKLEEDIEETFNENDAHVAIEPDSYEISVSGITHTDFDKICSYIENKYNVKPLVEEWILWI